MVLASARQTPYKSGVPEPVRLFSVQLDPPSPDLNTTPVVPTAIPTLVPENRTCVKISAPLENFCVHVAPASVDFRTTPAQPTAIAVFASIKQTLYRGLIPAPEIRLQVEPPFVVRRINPWALEFFPTITATLLLAAAPPLNVAPPNPLPCPSQDDPPFVVLSMTLVPNRALLPTAHPVLVEIKDSHLRVRVVPLV